MKHAFTLLASALLLPILVQAQTAGVGIGTTSPDRPLAIQALSGSVEWLSFKNNAGATKWHFNSLNGGFNLAESGVADYRLIVLPGGNVGLGTSTPGVRLEVAGQVKITGGVPGLGKVLVSDATGLASWQPASVGTTASQAAPTAATTLAPTAAVYVYTDNGSPNGILTLGTGTDGQRVTIKNLDSSYLAITSASGTGNLLSGYSLQYVYTGSGTTGTWNLIN